MLLVDNKKMFSKTLLIVLFLKVATSFTYDGYKVYKLTTTTEAQNSFLQSLELNPDYDFWSPINKVGNAVSLLVPPYLQAELEDSLQARKILFEVDINNVQDTINEETKYHSKLRTTGRISFDQYLRHDEINAYLDQLALDYPDLVTVSTIGQSYEKRTQKIIRISASNNTNPVLFIEAGMHAREWISPALALFIIDQLTTQNSSLLDHLDWVVLPSMNPDGYEFTWTTNRLWRKTRSSGIQCDGADGNRNFGFHWMENGASNRECSETYAGSSAFSEVEARNLRDVLNATENIAGFISLHSYGQYLFYPYSYDSVVPDNWQELDQLAQKAGAAIFAVNGTVYSIGASTDVLYPAAGCSDDWAMGGAGIEIVLTFELPGGGSAGFDLPPGRILPVCAETWEGIKVIADYVALRQ